MPVNIAARDGVQVGDAAKAQRKVSDSAARRSRFGVRTSVPPYGPMSCQVRSSAMNSTMFAGDDDGRVAGCASVVVARSHTKVVAKSAARLGNIVVRKISSLSRYSGRGRGRGPSRESDTASVSADDPLPTLS